MREFELLEHKIGQAKRVIDGFNQNQRQMSLLLSSQERYNNLRDIITRLEGIVEFYERRNSRS